ncbi:uncharacterized protein LOC101896008 isoform X2 [Musca domestica]|uniref:Uncharacterized protein LOC101896008 isoform X2 n=1 Tax=Musca domestica TaxID=7370 RepID=A0A9J7DH30_MUSDO|nr:uncharacterized protein LOC101896008 isoform X2 [Musca domestica]
MYFFQLNVLAIFSVMIIPIGCELLQSDCQCRDCECSKRKSKEYGDWNVPASSNMNHILRQRRKTVEELLRNFQMDLDNENGAIKEIRGINQSKKANKNVETKKEYPTKNREYLQGGGDDYSNNSSRENIKNRHQKIPSPQSENKSAVIKDSRGMKIYGHKNEQRNGKNVEYGGRAISHHIMDCRVPNYSKDVSLEDISHKHSLKFKQPNGGSHASHKMATKNRSRKINNKILHKVGEQGQKSHEHHVRRHMNTHRNDRETRADNMYKHSNFEEVKYNSHDQMGFQTTATGHGDAFDDALENSKNPKDLSEELKPSRLRFSLNENYSKSLNNLNSDQINGDYPLEDFSNGNLYSSLNDELQLKPNNLSDEANYKLSKIEQEAAESGTNSTNSFWRWPWRAAKRSSSSPNFNAMDEIKLKTSRRLMQKGYGPSLPSYSLSENLRELKIDNLLKSTEEEDMLRNKGKYNEQEVRDENLENFRVEADNMDWNPVDVVDKWTHIRRKRSIGKGHVKKVGEYVLDEVSELEKEGRQLSKDYEASYKYENFEPFNVESLDDSHQVEEGLAHAEYEPHAHLKPRERPPFNYYATRLQRDPKINIENKTMASAKNKGHSMYRHFQGPPNIRSPTEADKNLQYHEENNVNSMRKVRLHHAPHRKKSKSGQGSRKPLRQGSRTFVGHPRSENKNAIAYDKNLKDNDWPTHLYEHYPNTRSWLDAITKENSSHSNGTEDPNKISLELHNDLLNCTTYTSLDDFLKALPKNNTKTTVPTDEMEEIEVDFTTMEIEEYSNSENATEFYTDMDEGITTENVTEPEVLANESDVQKGKNSTTECVASTENWLEVDSTTEGEYEIPSNNTEDWEESSTTSEFPFNLSDNEHNDVKWNIDIKGHIHGNSKNKTYFGNGTILLHSDLMADDRHRRHTFRSMERKSVNDPNNIQSSENDKSPPAIDPPSLDLISGKSSANIVQKIFRTVREHPKLKILWPSLERNKLPERPQMANFYTIRNKDNDQKIQQSEQLMKQALNTLNDIIDQQVYSRSCLPLRPDLQDFYNRILKTQEEQNNYRKKRENDKKLLKTQKSTNKLPQETKDENVSEAGENVEEVRQLLRLYDGGYGGKREEKTYTKEISKKCCR